MTLTSTEAPTLAQSKVLEIERHRDTVLMPQLRALRKELAEIEAIAADWRSTSADVATAERVGEDRSRLQRRLSLLLDAQARAEDDLRVARAQVEVDKVQAVYNEAQRIGEQRVTTARNMMATTEMLIALIREHDELRFALVRATHQASSYLTAKQQMELGQSMNEATVQSAIEHTMGKALDKRLWEYALRGEFGATPDVVRVTEATKNSALITLRNAMEAITVAARSNAPAATPTADPARLALDRVQARARAEEAANGVPLRGGQ